jgi:hypothetical protein
MALITVENLDEKTFTNAEVLAILKKLGKNVYIESFGRVLDVVEELTGNRNFEDSKVDDAEKKFGNL